MQSAIIAAAISLLLSTGIIGCSEEDAGNIGKQLGNAAEKATEAASNAAEKATKAVSNAAQEAGNTIDQWTDQGTSDEKAGNKRADAADQQTSK
jgi:hypothetical protein